MTGTGPIVAAILPLLEWSGSAKALPRPAMSRSRSLAKVVQLVALAVLPGRQKNCKNFCNETPNEVKPVLLEILITRKGEFTMNIEV
jgi:hypothetical protein